MNKLEQERWIKNLRLAGYIWVHLIAGLAISWGLICLVFLYKSDVFWDLFGISLLGIFFILPTHAYFDVADCCGDKTSLRSKIKFLVFITILLISLNYSWIIGMRHAALSTLIPEIQQSYLRYQTGEHH